MNDNEKTQALARLPSYSDAMQSAEAYETAAKQWADVIASGWLPAHIKSPRHCMAIVEHGRAMGLSEWEALASLQLVQGNPTIKAEKARALIEKTHPGSIAVLESSNKACRIKCKQTDPVTGEDLAVLIEFTIEDAERAGLLNGKNPNWKKYPADMLFARCIGRVAKRMLPIGSGVWIAELVDDYVAQFFKKPRGLNDL